MTPTGPVGTKIKDRYLIERELGRGGFGVVYLARDEQLHSRPVVVKILLEHGAESEWFNRKFREEREALARLDHPGVVGVLDAGETAEGRPFLVMQYVDGVTLRSVLRNNKEVPLERVANLVRGIGHSLTAAHERGVVHRDLKPENIMLQNLGEGEELVKIIDFGIATIKESRGNAPEEATRVAGSGPYMAPEQLLGKPCAASDTYALGVIAYELATGQRPYRADSLHQMYQVQKEGIQAKPADLRNDLPAAAQEAILKALAFEPEQRYARARDFGDAFARAVRGRPAPVPAAAPRAGAKRRRPLVAAALVVLAAAALGGLLQLRQPERSFSYSILVQKVRNGQPEGQPFPLAGEMLFQADYQIRLLISSPQQGYLYLLNEGPTPGGGLPSYNILFPGESESAAVAADQVVPIPREGWIVFDEQEGTEKLWMVWSAASVPELEAAKSFAQAQDQGAVGDPSHIRAIQAFFQKHPAAAAVKRDEASRKTYVRGREEVLVKLAKLEHH
jgi:predicted Ser/Thr protein kinase